LSLCAALNAWSGLANADPAAPASTTEAPAHTTEAPAPATEGPHHGDAFVLLAPESELERCEPAPQPAAPVATQSVEQKAEAEAAKAPSATPRLEPETVVVSDAHTAYWSTERVVGWSLLGSAATASAVAIYFYDQQRDATDRYQELPGGPESGHQLAAIEDEYERARSVSLVAGSMAIGFAATGATLLILGNSEATLGPAPLLVVESTSARVGFSGHF